MNRPEPNAVDDSVEKIVADMREVAKPEFVPDSSVCDAINDWADRLAATRLAGSAGGEAVQGVVQYRHKMRGDWSEWALATNNAHVARHKAESRPDLFEVRELYPAPVEATPPMIRGEQAVGVKWQNSAGLQCTTYLTAEEITTRLLNPQPSLALSEWMPANIDYRDNSEWTPEYVNGFNDALELCRQEVRRLSRGESAGVSEVSDEMVEEALAAKVIDEWGKERTVEYRLCMYEDPARKLMRAALVAALAAKDKP